MKKTTLLLLLLFSYSNFLLYSQTTEDFEDEADISTTFTDNGQTFNINTLGSNSGPFNIDIFSNGGWNGSSTDNVFIDNTTGIQNNRDGASFSITTADGANITVKSFYLLVARSFLQDAATTVTVTGKKDGNTTPVFTFTRSTGFASATNFSPNNGYTFFNLITEGGTDNSNKEIDELIISSTGDADYLGLDAFRWDVGSANSIPTDISLTVTSINQSTTGTNATVGTLSTTDADVGDTHTYSLVSGSGSTNNSSFNISGNTLRTNSTLTPGTYAIRINTNDGTDDFAKPFTITVADNVAPSVPSTPDLSLSSDSAGASFFAGATSDNKTNDNTPTFTGTAEANATIRLFSNTNGQVGSVSANGSGNWSITASTLSEGSHTITATATDAANNTSGSSSGLDININVTQPTVAVSTTESDPTNGDSLGQIPVTITFSETVESFKENEITVVNGTTSDFISLDSISFNLKVTPANNGNVQVSINTGSATDDVGNFNTTSNTLSLTYDGTAPTVSSVSVPASGNYIIGQNLDFTVNFSENITVNTSGGTPQIGLTIGSTGRVASYISGSGNNALLFRYTLQSGDIDTDGITIGSLSANGGTLQDAANNNANLTLNSVGVTNGVLVNACNISISYPATTYLPTDTDPTPTIVGLTGGTFSATTGLTINGTSGIIDLSDSTPGIYTVTYTPISPCSTAATFNITILAKPTITSISDDTGVSSTDFITSDNTPTLNGTATAGSTIFVTVNGTSSAFLGISTTANSSGQYTFPFPAVFGNAQNGTTAFAVVSTLNGVSSTSDVRNVTIDTSINNPVITSPTAAATVNTTTQTIIGTHPENGAIVTAFADVNNDGTADNANSLGSATVSGGTWSISVNLTADTANNFVVEAQDTAGNTSDDVDVPTITQTSSITWTGNVDNNNWQTASNWSGNAVPPVSADVIVPNNVTNYPTISSAVTVNSINIASGASLITNATVTAPVTYTRNLPTTNWYLVSAPVAGETQQDVIANHTFATGTGGNIGIGAFQNNTGPAWVFANNSSTGPIISGAGVSMKLAAAGDLAITGNLNVTNISFPVATGIRNNFNLIGNPFTSYVNSTTLASSNSAIENATFWLWDGSQYVTYNNASPINIAPAQGFFVEANSTTNIVFSTANQSHQTTDTFQKKTPTPSFELFVESGDNKRATKVFYIQDKTTGFDSGYDSKIFGGVAQSFGVFTHLVSDNDGSKLAIQTLPNSNLNEMVIPVGVIAQAGTEVTFSLETSNFSEAVNVYLEDRINNTFTDITAGNTTVTVAEVANNIGQFYIHTQSKSLSTNTQTTATISIYASSKSEITVTGLQGKANVTLLSLLGKQVVSKQINSNGNSTILLPNLPTGVYIANLQTSTVTVTKKIIID